MHTAVDRFLGKSPTARLALAAFASIVVLVDLIVLVQVTGPTAVDSTVNVPTVTAPAPGAPVPSAVPSTSGSAEATQAPPMLVPPQSTAAPTPAPTPVPTPVQTRTRSAPITTARHTRPALPEPTQEGRGHRSPFEQRCRDGEIEPWLCRGLPN